MRNGGTLPLFLKFSGVWSLQAPSVVNLRNSSTYISGTSGDNGLIKQVENNRSFTHEIVSYMICSYISQQRDVF